MEKDDKKWSFCLKFILFLALYSIVHNSFARSFADNWLDTEEAQVSLVQDKALDITRDALLSIDYIENRTNYFLFKLKNMTFGNYTDEVMILAPFVTGRFEFSMYDLSFYYDHFNNNKSGVRYSVRF
jgi:hypothetical protein